MGYSFFSFSFRLILCRNKLKERGLFFFFLLRWKLEKGEEALVLGDMSTTLLLADVVAAVVRRWCEAASKYDSELSAPRSLVLLLIYILSGFGDAQGLGLEIDWGSVEMGWVRDSVGLGLIDG